MKTLIDLGPGDCRAPVGEAEAAIETTFCGAAVRPGALFRFCPDCAARLLTRAERVPRGRRFVLLGQRAAGAPKPRATKGRAEA